MNEQTTDTREEVELPAIDITAEESREACDYVNNLAVRKLVEEFIITAEHLQVRERQLRASLLACKKAEAAQQAISDAQDDIAAEPALREWSRCSIGDFPFQIRELFCYYRGAIKTINLLDDAKKKAEAANREKDAEIARIKEDMFNWRLSSKNFHKLCHEYRTELTSLRASVGDCVAMKMVLAIYRMQHKYDHHCEGDEICAACEQADKLLPAPPTKDKE